MKGRLNNLKEVIIQSGELYESQNKTELQNFTENIYYTQNITIQVVNVDGELLFTSGKMMGRGQLVNNKNFQDIYEEVLEEGKATHITQYSRLNMDVFTYSELIHDGKNIIIASIPIEPIQETISILQKQLIHTMVILLILSVIIGTFISKVFLKPILKLNESVNALSAGNMSARVEVTTDDEIGTLAKNFNKMADELIKIDILRKDLTANVSHELRTPLGLIKGYAELIRDINGENKEKRKENLEVIIEETDRLSSVVDDILNLSQIQSGYMKLSKETFDIVELSQSTMDKYKVATEKKGIDLKLHKTLDECLVNGDPKRMEQVLHNLLSNAINHTPEGGRISINIYEHPREFKVEIQDSGHGIPKEELDYIWDRYYKSNKDKLIRGTGLGLSIVKNILEAHHASYGVTSELGKGSTFYFMIEKS